MMAQMMTMIILIPDLETKIMDLEARVMAIAVIVEITVASAEITVVIAEIAVEIAVEIEVSGMDVADDLIAEIDYEEIVDLEIAKSF
jgi:hypothetical protein